MGNCNTGPLKGKQLTLGKPIYEVKPIDESPSPATVGMMRCATATGPTQSQPKFQIQNPYVYKLYW